MPPAPAPPLAAPPAAHGSPVPAPTLTEAHANGFTARQTTTLDSPFQAGHYPGYPIYPGVFFIASVSRAAIAAGRLVQEDRRLTAVTSVRFLHQHIPPAAYTIEASYTDGDAPGRHVAATCRGEAGQRLCTMKLVFDV